MMSSYRPEFALRGLAFSAIGYLPVLSLGTVIGQTLDEDSFAGLGLIALTVIVLAPIGAMAGAFGGLRAFAEPRRSRLTWPWFAVGALASAIVVAVAGFPYGVVWLILGWALSIVYRTGMGPHRPIEHSQPPPIRGVPAAPTPTFRSKRRRQSHGVRGSG